jgi:FtsP/CotA-like multicopper oxidase with cupredoxin domain
LRLENRYDGTPDTQRPMPVGGSFSYRLTFPDPGVYWYHPHIREDYGQEMGLYGNIVVVPSEPDYWPPVHREIALTLDDVLMDEGGIAPFRRSESNYTAMGRYGNVLLANGETDLTLFAQPGEVVRLYLTNTANTRVFNIALPGARMKLVGGDSGRNEREQFVDSVVIAPSERLVVDVLFERPGQLTLEHRTPTRTYAVATVTVEGERMSSSVSEQFEVLRTNSEMTAERGWVAEFLQSDPDKTLALVAEMDMPEPEVPAGSSAVYVCPMHPDVTSHEASRCPKCGMKLMPAQEETNGTHHHDHVMHADEMASEHHHHHDQPGRGDIENPAGIEWEDEMVRLNRQTTSKNMRWKLFDRATGREGAAIDWKFRVGDRVKIRLANEMDSDHPMHHPFHIHGAGRFLVLSRDGVVERNIVWKDTVLVPTGQTVDLLLEVTNPGLWMAHCHIAEHHESGMMLTFKVAA